MKTNEIKENLFWFFSFILLQIFFINRVLALLSFQVLLPVYLIPLIWLPINTNKYFVLLYAFVLGIVIDIFCFSAGVHSIITVFIGFIRIYILNLVASKNKTYKSVPSLSVLGLSLFIVYITIIYLSYFVLFVILEYFHLHSLWYSVGMIIVNVLINVGLLLGIEKLRKRF